MNKLVIQSCLTLALLASTFYVRADPPKVVVIPLGSNESSTYIDARFDTNLGDTVRNSESPWGNEITVPKTGNYLLVVSAYFSSTIDEEYASDSPDIKYDNRARLRIYVNDVSHKLLECGNGLAYEIDGITKVRFAPCSRSFTEVVHFEMGDIIRLTRNMQAVPATIPNLSIPDLWLASMDAFYIQKLD